MNETDVLRIAVAANMQYTIDELIETFEDETGINCEVVIGSSGKLTAQIMERAPFHLFISADMKYPQRLFESGLTTSEPVSYAFGRLILWKPVSHDSLDISMLSRPDVRNIAIPNPKLAPYGKAAEQVLDHWFDDVSVEQKLVYGESVSQTNQFILTGAAQVGITAQSVIKSPQMPSDGQWFLIDKSLHEPIEQGLVIIRSGKKENESARFRDFMLSSNGQEILMKYGYDVSVPSKHRP
jgi:molybdate transport system substrate-binding protein